MKSPFADSERERLIEAILPDVPFDGWSRRALRAAARRAGIPYEEATALFPRGAPDMVAAMSRWADRQMLRRLETALAQPPGQAPGAEPLGLSRRVALAIHARFEVMLPWREAARRGLSVLALPQNVPLGLRLLYDSVDAIWEGVGDHPTDFSYYTKRASLAAILAAATLYWLDDRSPDFADTDAFVERRLADLYRLTGIRRRLGAASEALPNPFRLFRPTR
ncbi:MAG: COQ9 family protein [Alphaproteobacteria bacterium]